MVIAVRSIRPDDELIPWLDAQTTAFLHRPDVAKIAEEVRQHWDFARVWGAFEDEGIVGTARTFATELTVPGRRQVKASALTAVSVRPTHRRRGILRRLLAAEHAAAQDRGENVSLLYAAEYPIYGRFAYGPACATSAWSIDARGTGVHGTAGGRTGSIEAIDIDRAAIDLIQPVFEEHRRGQAGEIWRRPITWLSDLGLAGLSWGDPWRGFLVVHRDEAGAVDGYARYRGSAKWEHRQPNGTLEVDELLGLTPDAEAALLRYLLAVDLVSTVKIEARTPTDRLPWLLTNARAAEPVEPGDGMWVRLHDPVAALEARAYERSGSLVLEVIDPEPASGGPERRVRLAIDATPEGARALSTERSPDLTIHASALGAAYLGGSRLRDAVLATGADEHRAGALDAADALLATREAPRCSSFF